MIGYETVSFGISAGHSGFNRDGADPGISGDM
jgi:hypothetical protein